MRTYSGHFKAVHDLSFQPLTGATFLSAAFDRMIKLWDTETGQVIARWDTGALPYCIRFNPTVEHQHEFLAGLSNKKILQYDVRSGEIVQEYDHHLAAINTITFCDEDKRFISTSDDKSLRAWEYGINVPIKYIAEPDMHSLVKVALHPSGKYIAAQSLNNTIQVFGATDRFRAQRKKVFSGHRNAGFQPDVAFSPDGKWLSSGDAGGYAVFWDWKTTRLYHKMKAHETVCSCIAWQPHETSRAVTAGWDGFIKYWD
jgi:pre-mRNA-processing factor 17